MQYRELLRRSATLVVTPQVPAGTFGRYTSRKRESRNRMIVGWYGGKPGAVTEQYWATIGCVREA